MELRQALKNLEESKEFKKWHKENKNTYFSYAFNIPQENDEWQLGYYNKKKDMITTFIVNRDSIKVRPEEEVFKKEGMKVGQIQLENVMLTFENAVSKANEFQQKNFPKEKGIKTIAILQNVPKLGNVWNITYITEAFNTLNMKINANNGKVLEHNLSSVFEFRQK